MIHFLVPLALLPAFHVAVHRSERFWGSTPCSGALVIREGKLPKDEIGLASWTVAAGRFSHCSIIVASTHCLTHVIEHEWGHLLGFQHNRGRTPAQRRVMRPTFLCRAQ